MIENFSNKGFVILKNAIPNKIVKDIQARILYSLKHKRNGKNKSTYKTFCNIVSKNKKKSFDFVKPINDEIYSKGFIEKILNQKKIYSLLSNILGKDLCFLVDNVITLNIPNHNTPKKNYHFKDWHQEIWSGADLATLQFWTPLFQKNNNFGQIQLIPDSHKWGHIPHSNRKPLSLPKKFKTFEAKLNLGDIIFFSTTLMHRSSETLAPRLALPGQVRNFRYSNRSFEYSRNWKIFSYSEITKIERALGNHYLSPYRLLDKDQISNFDQGTIAK